MRKKTKSKYLKTKKLERFGMKKMKNGFFP